jgi:hypothetical protein
MNNWKISSFAGLCVALAAGCSSNSGSDAGQGNQADGTDPVAACVTQWASSGATQFATGMSAAGGETDAGGVTARLLDANPSPPAVGDNSWTFAVDGPDGNPLMGATIKLTQKMPAHGHGGVKTPVVTDNGDGTYDLSPINFNMDGFWLNHFEVVNAAQNIDETLSINICVQ